MSRNCSNQCLRRVIAAGAMTLTGILALSACSGNASGESAATETSESEGVPFGASQEDYIAAFDDVEPITLNAQTPAPQGSSTGMHFESYMEKVEEWSGGKISFEIGYSNAIADPADIDNALVDGRLDLGGVLPIYEPSDYPATTALIESAVLSDGTAIAGPLHSNAWPNEVAFNTPEIMEEWDQAGLIPLVPVFNSGTQGLFCSSEHASLESLSGSSISAAGTLQSQQLEALGASPVSIAYTELFESLQRGVVACSLGAQTTALLGGFLPEAPYVTMDAETTFADAPGGLAFSKAKWDTLPIQAQQLLWDSLDVFIGENITEKIWPNAVEADQIVQEANGEFLQFEEETRQVLQDANDQVINTLRDSPAVNDSSSFVDAAETTSQEWMATVKELGYPDDIPYEGFAALWEQEEFNIDRYLDKVMEEIYQDHRPE